MVYNVASPGEECLKATLIDYPVSWSQNLWPGVLFLKNGHIIFSNSLTTNIGFAYVRNLGN